MSTVLTQGWSGLAISYAAVQGPMLAGLARGRAKWHKFLLSPAIAAPLTATVGAAMAMAAPLMAGIGVAQHGVIPFALATSLSAAIGYAGGRAMSRGPSDGKDPSTRRDGRGATASRIRASARQRTDPRKSHWRRRPVAAQDETKHFKLIGTTGTGKSTAIQEILNGALARGDRAVIADPDGGYLRQFHDGGRGDTILNPFDRRSVKWDLFSEISNAYDVDQLARSLIPDHEGADRSWRGYARTFFSSVTRQMHEAGATDMAELYRLLVAADVKELRTLVRGTAAQPFLDEHNSRMFDSIRSVTSSAVGALDYIVQQKAPTFSIRHWVSEERPGVLFMPYKAGQIAALGSTISAWMRLAIFEAMDREEQGTEHSDEQREAVMVRDRRAGCARANRRTEGRARAVAKIQRPMRSRLSIDRASLQHLWTRETPIRSSKIAETRSSCAAPPAKAAARRGSPRSSSATVRSFEPPCRAVDDSPNSGARYHTATSSMWNPRFCPRKSNSCRI